jgi:thymidylate synthase (FAD)
MEKNMKTRLISYSQPPEDTFIGLDDVQDLIAYCARVSNPTNQLNSSTSEKLLNYLAKHKHWSPFEMVSACIEVETTRDIARQLLRHRSFSFQEFSQRYADPVKELEFVKRECRLQDPKNRQNSIEIEGDPSLVDNQKHQDLIAEWGRRQSGVIDIVKRNYEWAVENGIAKEQARALLPEGLTVSRLYVNGTIRSWIHYVELRSANGTQKEHITLARDIGKAIAEIFPLAEKYINKK